MFAAATASMSLAALGNLNALIFNNVEATYLALLFPMVYVLAERMELGFVRGMKPGTMKVQTVVAWSAVLLAFASSEIHIMPYSQSAMIVSIILIFSLMMNSMRFDPAFGRLRRQGRFQAFMRAGVLLSFFWLFLGLVLFALQLVVGHGFMDAATHQ